MFCRDCGMIIGPTKRKQHQSHGIIMHPTQKPLDLTDKLVKSCRLKASYNVLIPFCGSGSECISVLQNQGNYTAFEVNADYVLLANKNIENFHLNEKNDLQMRMDL